MIIILPTKDVRSSTNDPDDDLHTNLTQPMGTSDDDSMENSRDDEVKDAPSQLDHSDSGMF